jgi:hypothetical protein
MITILKNFLAALFNNHYRLTVFICIIAIFLSVSVYDLYTYEKIAGKVANLAFYLLATILFNKFYLKYNEDTDKAIFSNPIALAIYLGFNAFAIAFICAN